VHHLLGLGVRFLCCVSMSLHRVPQRGLRERVSIYCSTYRPYGYSCYGDNFVQRLDTQCECDPDVGGRAGLITQTIGIPQLGVLGLKRMTTQCSGEMLGDSTMRAWRLMSGWWRPKQKQEESSRTMTKTRDILKSMILAQTLYSRLNFADHPRAWIMTAGDWAAKPEWGELDIIRRYQEARDRTTVIITRRITWRNFSRVVAKKPRMRKQKKARTRTAHPVMSRSYAPLTVVLPSPRAFWVAFGFGAGTWLLT
jgi:hypothetical protein